MSGIDLVFSQPLSSSMASVGSLGDKRKNPTPLKSQPPPPLISDLAGTAGSNWPGPGSSQHQHLCVPGSAGFPVLLPGSRQGRTCLCLGRKAWGQDQPWCMTYHIPFLPQWRSRHTDSIGLCPCVRRTWSGVHPEETRHTDEIQTDV